MVWELFERDFLFHWFRLQQHVVRRGKEEEKVIANFLSVKLVYLRPELFDDLFGRLLEQSQFRTSNLKRLLQVFYLTFEGYQLLRDPLIDKIDKWFPVLISLRCEVVDLGTNLCYRWRLFDYLFAIEELLSNLYGSFSRGIETLGLSLCQRLLHLRLSSLNRIKFLSHRCIKLHLASILLFHGI